MFFLISLLIKEPIKYAVVVAVATNKNAINKSWKIKIVFTSLNLVPKDLIIRILSSLLKTILLIKLINVNIEIIKKTPPNTNDISKGVPLTRFIMNNE